jgi:predicted nucleic acid-binding protein
VPEALSGEALGLLAADHELLAPDILRLEASNTLLRKVRQRELMEEAALDAIAALPRYLQLSPAWNIFEEAVGVALQFRCTLFDALYVLEANNEDCPLITSDERLIRNLQRPFAGRIIWLGDLAPDV